MVVSLRRNTSDNKTTCCFRIFSRSAEPSKELRSPESQRHETILDEPSSADMATDIVLVTTETRKL